jgi:transcription termination factor Rho
MNKADLESKHLAELHTLAAEAGIERYRMLSRDELIDKLADGASTGGGAERSSREPRRRSESRGGRGESRGGRGESRGGRGESSRGGRRESQKRRQPRRDEGRQQSEPDSRQEAPAPSAGSGEESQPRRRRRRRRFGRRGRKTVRVTDVLLPASPGQQALVYSESRAGCTALLRELASELSGGRGPDPVALLVDPTPEELAEWKREAPKAEIVSAGQERHAEDALAQAVRRAESGEAVVFLIDSLSRVAEEFGGSKVAKELFDSGRSAGAAGAGSLTIVAAIERAG